MTPYDLTKVRITFSTKKVRRVLLLKKKKKQSI